MHINVIEEWIVVKAMQRPLRKKYVHSFSVMLLWICVLPMGWIKYAWEEDTVTDFVPDFSVLGFIALV